MGKDGKYTDGFLRAVIESTSREYERGRKSAFYWRVEYWKAALMEKILLSSWRRNKSKENWNKLSSWADRRFLFGMFLKGYGLDWHTLNTPW